MHDHKEKIPAELPANAIIILEPPFLNEEGRYDAKSARAWQKMKLRPRMFYANTYRAGADQLFKTPPYVRPKNDLRLKGKSAIKAAKRARVKERKANDS